MTTKPTRTIDEEINRILEELKTIKPGSPEYEKASINLESLCRSRSFKANQIVSADTLVLAATNILGILLILNYEQIHVVTSKTLGLLVKGRM